MSDVNQPIDPKVVARLQKLLALAASGSGATEAEAESAMARAQAIMADNNLTMATLEAEGKKGSGDAARTKTRADGRAMYEYQQRLMSNIAMVNFCSVFIIYKFNGRRRFAAGYQLIGRQANVASTLVMFDYLMKTINRLVLEAVHGDNSQRMTKFGIAFAEGCADRLGQRLRRRHADYLAEQAKEARERNAQARHPAAATGGALVVVMQNYATQEQDLNDDFNRGLEPGTTARRRADREARVAARLAELCAQGIEAEVARYMADYGFSFEQAHAHVHPPEETDEERAKREAREQRDRERAEARWEREYNRRNWSGYYAGQEAGDRVGLDPQVDRAEPRRQIGG
jgi:hypothetical protein